MKVGKLRSVVKLILIFSCYSICFAFIGEEMQSNKGPLLQNVESKPFVSEKRVLLRSEILSPDEVLKDVETLSSVWKEDQTSLHSFNLDHFVDITQDSRMKQGLESTIMGLFLNASQVQLDSEQNARVSNNIYDTGVYNFHCGLY